MMLGQRLIVVIGICCAVNALPIFVGLKFLSIIILSEYPLQMGAKEPSSGPKAPTANTPRGFPFDRLGCYKNIENQEVCHYN